MPEEVTTYTTTDTELTSIADAIREKTGDSDTLEYPTEFVSAIRSIPTGGGGEAYNIRVGGNSLPVASNCTINQYQIVFTSGSNQLVPMNNTNTVDTGKSLNTLWFVGSAPVYVYTGETAITAGNIPSAEYLYTKYSNLDLRYATNCGTTLIAGKPVYIRLNLYTYGYTNTFQLYSSGSGTVQVIQNFPINLGQYSPGYYMRLGTAVSDHEIEFEEVHPIYRVSGSDPRVSIWDYHIPSYNRSITGRVLTVGYDGTLTWDVPDLFNPSDAYSTFFNYTYNPNGNYKQWAPKDGFSEQFWSYYDSSEITLTKTALQNSTWKYEGIIPYFGSNNMYSDTDYYESLDNYFFSMTSFQMGNNNDWLSWENIYEHNSGDHKQVIVVNGVERSIHIPNEGGEPDNIEGTITLTLIPDTINNDISLKVTFVLNFNSSGGDLVLYEFKGYAFEKSDMATKLSGGGGGSITVDSALDSTSTNPVENRAIYSVIGDVESLLQAI